MAGKQMNQLSTLSTLADADLLLAYDIDEGGSEKTKSITYAEFETQISGAVGGDSTPASLYYNGTDIKATATAAGISITDGTAAAATIGFSGENLIIKNNDANGLVYIYGTRDVGTQSAIMTANPDSNVIFYYDGVQVFATRPTGITIYSTLGGGQSCDYYYVGDSLHIKSNVDGGLVKIEGDHVSDSSQSFMATFDPDGAAELYYAGDKKFETLTDGIQFGDGTDTAYMRYFSGLLQIRNQNNGGGIEIRGNQSGGLSKLIFQGDADAAAHVYHAGNISIETRSDGIEIRSATGLNSRYFVSAGISGIYTPGTSMKFKMSAGNSGNANTTMIYANPDGAAELYHAGDKQFETVVSGVEIPEDSFMYFGDTTTSGSWRMGISGEDFVHQKYNGSDWETKQTVVG